MIKPKAHIILLLCTTLAGCASFDISKYPNVQINEQKKVEAISFARKPLPTTPSLKECVTSVLHNPDIDIRDSRNSRWVPIGVLQLIIPDVKGVIKGGDVVISEGEGTIDAVGSTPFSVMPGINEFLIYRLKVEMSPTSVNYQFSNIRRLMEDTGYGKNPGAFPLGTHTGSRFEKLYSEIENVADSIQECLVK